MNKWRLPTTLRLGVVDFAIRTDFRVILGIFRVFHDAEYTEAEKIEIALRCFYPDADKIEDVDEAVSKMFDFFTCGRVSEEDDRTRPQLMDWDQDADIIIPAVNKAAGLDVRGLENLHWWTFMSYYMEIDSETTFATVVGIRKKMAYGEKLEPYERNFVRDNPNTAILKDAERRAQDADDRAELAKIGL